MADNDAGNVQENGKMLLRPLIFGAVFVEQSECC